MNIRKLLLLTLFFSGTAYAEEGSSSLRALMKPAHAQALEGAETQVRKIAGAHLKAADAAVASELLDLLDQPRKPAPKPEALVGEWKVRSLQAAAYGVYSYPYFKSRIHQEGELGLIFHKDTGSQRRLGNLVPDGTSRYLFLGGSYVQGEPSRGYSGFQDESVQIDPSQDSVGYLYQIASGHLIIIFVGSEKRAEIYELKKA